MLRMRRALRVGDVWTRWRAGEAGMGEALVAIIVLPFMVALIFVLVEVGFNLRFRAAVDAITQDAARGVAQDGGNFYAPTNTLGQAWSDWGTAQLVTLCGTTSQRCKTVPTMACSPQIPAALPGVDATCTATFDYKPIATFTSTNPVFNLGFGNMWNRPISTTVTGRTVVGTG
jgi:Flp pilus assembly protein TadG